MATESTRRMVAALLTLLWSFLFPFGDTDTDALTVGNAENHIFVQTAALSMAAAVDCAVSVDLNSVDVE